MTVEPEMMASWVTLAFIAGNLATLAAWAAVTRSRRRQRHAVSALGLEPNPRAFGDDVDDTVDHRYRALVVNGVGNTGDPL